MTPGEIAERGEAATHRRERAAAKAAGKLELARRSRQRAQRLEKAAGISHVQLVCHSDTWRFISTNTFGPYQLDAPREDRIEVEDNRRKRIHVSQLVKILNRMQQKAAGYFAMPDYAVVDQAIAKRVYAAIADVVDTVVIGEISGGEVSPIYIDDRIPIDHGR